MLQQYSLSVCHGSIGGASSIISPAPHQIVEFPGRPCGQFKEVGVTWTFSRAAVVNEGEVAVLNNFIAGFGLIILLDTVLNAQADLGVEM
jgi:hypothetical protein